MTWPASYVAADAGRHLRSTRSRRPVGLGKRVHSGLESCLSSVALRAQEARDLPLCGQNHGTEVRALPPSAAAAAPSASALALAEDLNTHLPLGAGDERIVRPDAVIFLGGGGKNPAFTVVQRLRLNSASLPAAVAEIRAILRSRGRPEATFEVGPSAEPADLRERLLALGMTRCEEPIATGMILTRSLPRLDSRVVAARAETVEDYVAGFQVLNAVFAERAEHADQRRERAEQRLAADRAGRGAFFVGRLGGETIAAANALYTPEAVVLGGSGTLPAFRGRGAYRALVAARFADAATLGTPTLVIQAGAMSRPILERLGFETVCRIEVLLDRA